MKLFSGTQIREWDKTTLEEEDIPSIELMERASSAFTKKFMERYDRSKPLAVFCGPGNNGGDGLAIARMLNTQGYEIKVWLADWGLPKSPDYEENLKRLPGFGQIPVYTIDMKEPPILGEEDIIIDALLGTGLNRPLDGNFEDLIYWLNSLHKTVVSVDLPSGMFTDQHTGLAIRASHTITFQTPKMAMLLPEYEEYTGSWEIVDIGLSQTYYLKTTVKHYLVEKKMLKGFLTTRKKFSHKGLFGHALLINGSHGKGGAAILAAKACLRSGVGLVTNHIPGALYGILQMAVPEAMASVDEHNYYWSTLPKDLDKYAAIGLGCGLDQKDSTARVLSQLFDEYDGRMVIDADALNLISKSKELLGKLNPGSILTPHLKEFERLFGKSGNCFDRLSVLSEKSKQHQVTIILKGAFSSIASPDGTIFFNPSGNPGMATAGSGDVLTGLLTGLLAQGYDSTQAAILGTYIHGAAGDLALKKQGGESLVASDIIKRLGEAFKEVRAA